MLVCLLFIPSFSGNKQECPPDLHGSGRGPVVGSREHCTEVSGSEKAGNFFIIWATMLQGIMSLIWTSRGKENANMQNDSLVSASENALGPFFSYIHLIVPCSVRIIWVLYNARKGVLKDPLYNHQSHMAVANAIWSTDDSIWRTNSYN